MKIDIRQFKLNPFKKRIRNIKYWEKHLIHKETMKIQNELRKMKKDF